MRKISSNRITLRHDYIKSYCLKLIELTVWLTPHIKTDSNGSFARNNFTFWCFTRMCFFFNLLNPVVGTDILDLFTTYFSVNVNHFNVFEEGNYLNHLECAENIIIYERIFIFIGFFGNPTPTKAQSINQSEKGFLFDSCCRLIFFWPCEVWGSG